MAKLNGICYNKAWRWCDSKSKKHLHDQEEETGKRKLIQLPNGRILKRLFTKEFESNGVVADSWKDLVKGLIELYPSLKQFRYTSVVRAIRSRTPLRSYKVKRKPALATTRGFHQRQLLLSSILTKLLLDKSPIAFFDETIVSFKNFKQTAIGTKVLAPLCYTAMKTSVRLLVMFTLEGKIAFQILTKDPTAKEISYFFEEAVPTLMASMSNPRRERLTVVLDNAKPQSSQEFLRRADKLPIVLTYNVVSSPYINMVEDLFLRLKRSFRQKLYEKKAEIIPVLIQNMIDGIREGFNWIVRRFVSNCRSRLDCLGPPVPDYGQRPSRPPFQQFIPPDIDGPRPNVRKLLNK